jgi:hypothetical protein
VLSNNTNLRIFNRDLPGSLQLDQLEERGQRENKELPYLKLYNMVSPIDYPDLSRKIDL